MSSAEDQVAQDIRREEECNTKGMAQGQHETPSHRIHLEQLRGPKVIDFNLCFSS